MFEPEQEDNLICPADKTLFNAFEKVAHLIKAAHSEQSLIHH